ncbi:unnamed protein product [Lathyrus oleraceus]|uniref:Uncharacterized protein n=1 Tax=Pisum sativum TaxID=3888 RepID=A0A9D5AJI0_PEA|nr:uncharacterized protein LOC127085132 isoform X1 [Pisum sativum]KAI5409704.1 hypothetical protein KIW84_055231 [Pisum sativum]
MKEKNRNMVAISLYRGNLHRTPDLPRRWLMPNPKISLKDFKSLLARRSKALSRSSNPNPNPLSSATNRKQLQLSNQPPELVDSNKPLHGSDFENHAFEKPSHAAATSIEKHTHPVIGNVDMHHDKDKRKKEVEAKLQVLNAKKHSLVLVLKQILNAEEDLKRRNSLQQQGVVMRGPSVPPKADGTNDTGSDTKYLALRLGSDGNLGDLDGVEPDDFTNHNHNMQHSQLVLPTSSMSPSSESPLTRTPTVQQNMVSNPARASFTSAGSPSCFAHSGQHGNPPNLPSASVSGTSYIASSPSPAASGGTSVYRDAGHPSPWK